MIALSLIAVIAGALLVPLLALHVWYAIGLSRVFATHGAEAWRAWIPLVNEAEIFRLGRLDPVRAVLLVVPLVNVYGLVLKATAAHRIGTSAGRGAGATALAVIFPPAWATLLAAKPRTDATPALADSAAPAPALVRETTASGPIATVPGTDAAQLATAGRRRSTAVVAEPVAVPVLPGPVDIDEVAFEQTSIHPSRRRGAAALDDESAGDAPAGVVPETTAAASAPAAGGSSVASVPAAGGSSAGSAVVAGATAAGSTPVSGAASGGSAAVSGAASASSAAVSGAGPAAPTPVSAAGPATPTPVSAASAAVSAADPAPASVPASAPGAVASPSTPASSAAAPAPEDLSFDRVAETTDSTAAPAPERAAVPAGPVEEHTQTVRQRSRRRGEWSLTLPDGQTVALVQRTVVLGRKPGDAEESVQHIAVADETRTMSKTHARLEWTVTGWMITDLDSTNGVTLVHDDGRTERVAPGGTAVAPGRFRLGDAPIQLRPAPTA